MNLGSGLLEFWRSPLLVLCASQSHEVICQGKGSFWGWAATMWLSMLWTCSFASLGGVAQIAVDCTANCKMQSSLETPLPGSLTSIPSGLG